MTLSNHQRSRRGFSETFARTAEQTITAMDRGGHDIPNQTPVTPLLVKRVGLKRSSIPVKLTDPFGGSEPIQLSCDVDVAVSLEGGRRGIHVSRIGDVLARLSGETYVSLQQYAGRLAETLKAAQQSENAHTHVQGVFTYLENVVGVKEKRSLEHLTLIADADLTPNGLSLGQGLGFSHITACPCVQETYRNSFGSDDQQFLASIADKRMPLLTHTQRCETKLFLRGLAEQVVLRDLVACIDAGVVRSQNTLPREFELLNVQQAHAKPQFLEDVLRDLLARAYRMVRKRNTEGTIRVVSSSMESIHDFDLGGEIEYSLGELDAIFA